MSENRDGIKSLGRELIAAGSIVDFYKEILSLPNGNVVRWDLISHKRGGAAAILPVRSDGKLLLVRQYRFPVGRDVLEIPAGGRDSAEEPTIVCAARELEEETGYTCDDLEFLVAHRGALAYCDEKIDIYLARDLKPGRQHLDENEFLNVEAWDLEDLKRMILAGEIEDSKTICAVLAYACKITGDIQ